MIRLPSLPLLAGLTLGLLLAIGSGSGETRFSAADVQCYPTPASMAMRVPDQSVQPGVPAADALAQHARAVDITLGQTAASAAHCISERCSIADAQAATRDLAHYLRQRRELTTRLYRDLGPQGLEVASQLYTGPHAQAIHRHAATLITQRTIAVADLVQEREALALALFKDAREFRPCEAMRRPVYRGYVY